jgi:uncharacterized damage-inducible protein DinB
MDKSVFGLLAKYNKETNEKMNRIINSLSDEDWNKRFSGYYKSIHELCSHIYGGDHRWLKRFKMIRDFESLNDVRFNIEYDFHKLFFENVSEYLTKRIELDSILINFVHELSEDDLEKKLKWKNSKGIENIHTLGTGLIHLSHHETHHRGMISLYLENIGKENDYGNLYPYEKEMGE